MKKQLCPEREGQEGRRKGEGALEKLDKVEQGVAHCRHGGPTEESGLTCGQIAESRGKGSRLCLPGVSHMAVAKEHGCHDWAIWV